MNDDTEITYSEVLEDGKVKVYIETPDDNGGFRNAICYLPDHARKNARGYSEKEMAYFKKLVCNNAHIIMTFAQEEGGILSAAAF